MAKSSVLGILPTGTGKSLCYQLPALSMYHRTGALTVVISPLVALMADQVAGLKKQGISSCITVNGLLSLPERHDALDQVRLGDAAMLLISPEQLRNPSVRSVLDQREVGYWVVDEAHCVSKWGHDFRPDYRYIARFIREYSSDSDPAPLICLTATAKPGVIEDICEHFEEKLGIGLERVDGGAHRDNLSFEVIPTEKARKLGDIVSVLEDALPAEGSSGAIVYCATRSATERVADFLKEKGYSAGHYHAGLKPEAKLETQQQFADGALRVIAATNAFGMGIDKSDIRLVVHADIPGSIENYVQEAGRAGRDGKPARCVLLYSNDDIEKQFELSARSRLDKQQIAAILKSLRRLARRSKREGEVVATPGEIVKEDLDGEFGRDRDTDDTRVKIAVSWLEESVLHCIHGVDVNPMAVELAKLALWLETVAADAPLTFLDHHLQCGDSLMGVTIKRLNSLPGDEGLLEGQFTRKVEAALPALLEPLAAINEIPSDTAEHVSRDFPVAVPSMIVPLTKR